MDQAQGAFVSTFDGKVMEASLLLAEVGFLDITDLSFAATVVTWRRIECHDNHISRYVEKGDFGELENVFCVCPFW